MIGQTFGHLSVLLGLFLFGLVYNAFVAWIERHKAGEAITSLLVAFGALITIGGIHLLELVWDLPAAVLALLAFAASGTPMIIGSLWRFVTLYRQALEFEKEQSKP